MNIDNRNIQVIKTKDPNIVQYLIPYMEKLINKTHEDYSLESFLRWYRFNIQNPLVGTWVAIKKGNSLFQNDTGILGYSIGTVTTDLEKEYFNITHIYSKDKSITKLLFTTMENWVKKNGMNTIGGITKRSPKAWQKKFGYKLVSYNLVKEI